MARDYVYDQSFAQERARIAGMEALWDPGSRALLDELGIGDGWKCLEVGAGGGSLVEWMAGRGATVTAIDIDTRFIEHLASNSITVRRIDVREDELPQAEFDLVHARLVLEHLTDRRQILDRLAATLRPGGWIVIEDYDFTGFGFEGDDPQLENRVGEAINSFMQRAGFEPRYGRYVVGDLEAVGLTDVRGEGRARVIDSSSPGFDFFRLSFESIRGALVDAGLISAEDADTASAGFGRQVHVVTPLMVAGIGRRSGQEATAPSATPGNS
jgi:SAM-dependent methyltransferase